MSGYSKPLPVIDAHSKPYWEAAKRRELRLPRCTSCSQFRATFEKWCPHCGGESFEWGLLSGKGTVWSHCAFHKAYFPAFAPDLPYNVALVELAEGPRLITNIVGPAYEEITVGMPVEVFFDDVTPEVTLVRFKPAAP